MSTLTPLQDLDNIIAQAHAAAVAALAKAEQDLAKLTVKRDQLADRVQRLSLALPLGGSSERHTNEAPAAEIPAGEVASIFEEADAEPTPSPKRNLWDDVEAILSGRQRAIRTKEILKKLIAMGWQDSEATKNNLANSFSRWTKEGKLERRGRGLYRLGSMAPEVLEESTPADDTTAETTAVSTPAEDTPAEDTPAETISAEDTPGKTTPGKTTPAAANSLKGTLWEDVQSILSGSGAVKTSDLFVKLVELGHPDSESAKKNLHMATARWTRRGMLEKLGRGLYGLASAETEVVVETESTPAESSAIESVKAEEMPTVEPVPATLPKDSLPTAPESMSPQPEDLWNAVRQILRRGQPVKAAVIVDTLNQKGWDFRSPEDRDEVYEVLRAWSKQGHVLWGRAGVVVVG